MGQLREPAEVASENGGRDESLSTREQVAARIDLFHVRIADDADCTRVAVFGELDIATVEEVDETLRRVEADDGQRRIVVDLSGLQFMDSTGLRTLLAAHERLGDRLKLLRGPAPVHRVFEVTGTSDCLPFAD